MTLFIWPGNVPIVAFPTLVITITNKTTFFNIPPSDRAWNLHWFSVFFFYIFRLQLLIVVYWMCFPYHCLGAICWLRVSLWMWQSISFTKQIMYHWKHSYRIWIISAATYRNASPTDCLRYSYHRCGRFVYVRLMNPFSPKLRAINIDFLLTMSINHQEGFGNC